MGRNGLSAVLVAVGLGIVGVSLAADAIGIGASDYVFGWEQKLGVAVGMSIAWLTCARMFRWRASGAQHGVEPVSELPTRPAPVRAAA